MRGRTRKAYSPKKYFSGLSTRKRRQRRAEIRRFGSRSWRNPLAYLGFKTNRGVKTKKSKYTRAWEAKHPGAKSLAQRSAASGVPLPILRAVYNRGMAAWRTGHRPGASQQAWAYARVSSFLTKGKTYYTADADLAKKVRAH